MDNTKKKKYTYFNSQIALGYAPTKIVFLHIFCAFLTQLNLRLLVKLKFDLVFIYVKDSEELYVLGR
jgi:hypothetical protein